MKKTLILSLILLLTFSGCLHVEKNATEESTETEKVVGKEVNEDGYDNTGLFPQDPYRLNKMTDWEDEISSEYLFKFKYPPEMWTFSNASEGWGYSNSVATGEGTYPFEMMVKDPTLITDNLELKELYSKNLEEYLMEACNISNLEEIKDSFRGRDAYRLLTSDCKDGIEELSYLRLKRSIFTEYNGLIYELSYVDHNTAFNILASFEFIPENERPEALNRDSYEYCLKKFKNQSNKEKCLRYYYIEEDACKEFTENKSYRAECYWYLALQSKDQSICENLSEETIENVNDKDSVYGILDFNVGNCKNAISYTADGVEWNITGVDLDGGIGYSGNTILEGWVYYGTYYSSEDVPFFHVADMTKLPPTIRDSDYFLKISGAEKGEFKYIPAELLEKLKDYDENNTATLLVNRLSIGCGTSYLSVVEILE